MDSISNNLRTVRVLNATAAGYADIAGATIDRQGANSVRYVVLFGAISASPIIRVLVLESDAANMSGASTVSGIVTIEDGSADNKLAILEHLRPTKRYLQLRVMEIGGTAAIDGAICELGGLRQAPSTADASVAGQAIYQQN